ncbi:UNVERIFIED_CONTAM: hypothetical protein Sradi_2108100 [Sesamum radiatum]|uniref:Reverse transcriptase domain-containing protein n=1 Tax=Sesamum radiatum TaxID=300843 RepID=A0AAW2TKH9_SESRA
MLAQELFMGYNQRHLPKRCALKVDLRKAYDTVEWDFLLEVLRLFGASRFISWIDECVTTPSYSVCINGEAHGFFQGARGLRQLILSKAAYTERTQLLQLIGFQEARVQLIKSVLMAINTYWVMAFVLPKGVIKEIERRLRSLLWQGTTGFGYSKVAWARVCTPIEEGGLGIRNLPALNMAMIARKLWEVVRSESRSIWVQWIYRVQPRGGQSGQPH